ncbi:MAG: cupin domain-containing protein [Thiobacillus sp.]|nr:cupin domain-containing protein [Thiobacillus sp.]
MSLIVERAISQARQTELGVHGWPTWKDAEGERTLPYDAAENSYFLAGSATLTPEGGEPVTVNAGDLVVIPAGRCLWQVHSLVRRHYRSEGLTPACCII